MLVPATTTYGRCTEYFIFVCASCDNLNQDVCYIFFIDLTNAIFYLYQLCQPMPAAHSVNFLSVPTVTTCTSMYVIHSSLVSLNVIFVLVPAMTTYGGCIEYFIFACATCDNMNQHICYIYSSLISLVFCICLCQLWQPMPGTHRVIFLPMPAVTPCARYVDCYISDFVSCDNLFLVSRFYISTYASYDDLCWVYRVFST